MNNGWILMMLIMIAAGYMNEKLKEQVFVSVDEKVFRTIYSVEINVMICLFCTIATVSILREDMNLFLWDVVIYGATYLILFLYTRHKAKTFSFENCSYHKSEYTNFLQENDPQCRAFPLPSEEGYLWRIETGQETFTIELNLERMFPEKWIMIKRDDVGESNFATVESILDGCIYEVLIEKEDMSYLCQAFIFDHGNRIEVALDLFQVAKLLRKEDGSYDIWLTGSTLL